MSNDINYFRCLSLIALNHEIVSLVFCHWFICVEEWRENFGMSRISLLRLTEELHPYIEGKDTVRRSFIDHVKQIAITLYHLSDESHICKTANAFGVSRQSVSKIVKEVCKNL